MLSRRPNPAHGSLSSNARCRRSRFRRHSSFCARRYPGACLRFAFLGVVEIGQGFAKPLLNGLVSVSPVGASCAISLQHIQLLLRRPAATAIASWYATVWAGEAEVKEENCEELGEQRSLQRSDPSRQGRAIFRCLPRV